MKEQLKKFVPMFAAGAMIVSGSGITSMPVFAADETNVTKQADDASAKSDATTSNETASTTEKKEATAEQLAAGSEVLGKLQNIDTKTLTEQQVTALNQVIANLKNAIEQKDGDAIVEVANQGKTILDGLANATTTTDTSEDEKKATEEAKFILDKAAIALEQNSTKWTAEQKQSLTDLCTALQAAVTGGNLEEIRTASNNVVKGFSDLGVDLATIQATNAQGTQATTQSGANGTIDAKSNTGIASSMPALVGTITVALGASGLTYKFRKKD